MYAAQYTHTHRTVTKQCARYTRTLSSGVSCLLLCNSLPSRCVLYTPSPRTKPKWGLYGCVGEYIQITPASLPHTHTQNRITHVHTSHTSRHWCTLFVACVSCGHCDADARSSSRTRAHRRASLVYSYTNIQQGAHIRATMWRM